MPSPSPAAASPCPGHVAWHWPLRLYALHAAACAYVPAPATAPRLSSHVAPAAAPAPGSGWRTARLQYPLLPVPTTCRRAVTAAPNRRLRPAAVPAIAHRGSRQPAPADVPWAWHKPPDFVALPVAVYAPPEPGTISKVASPHRDHRHSGSTHVRSHAQKTTICAPDRNYNRETETRHVASGARYPSHC